MDLACFRSTAGAIFTALHEPFRHLAAGDFETHRHWPVLIAAIIISLLGLSTIHARLGLELSCSDNV